MNVFTEVLLTVVHNENHAHYFKIYQINSCLVEYHNVALKIKVV